MFDSILHKGHARNLTAYIVFGAVCVVFVFFGVTPDQGGPQGGAIVAEVDNTVITVGDLRRLEERQIEFYSRMTGGNIDDRMRQMIRSNVVRELVQREVAAQGASLEGVFGSDREVFDQLLSIPEFQVNGRFSRQRYLDLLQANRLEVGSFEADLRKEAAAQRLRAVFESSLEPTTVEVDFDKSLKQNKLNLKYLLVDSSSLEKAITVSAKELRAFIESADGSKKIADYYASKKQEFELPEKVRARHILIKAKRGDAVAEDQALKKIGELAQGLTPEKFAEVAKSSSQDEASRGQGGDLGLFGRGTMVPEFEKVAFSLQPGAVSQPVRSDFGYHLILVEEKQDKRVPPLNEVSQQIGEKLWRQERVTKGLADLDNLLKEKSLVGLDKWARDWQVKWEETGVFSLADPAIPKLGEDESLFRAAAKLSPEQPVAPLVKVEGKSYVLRWQAAREAKSAAAAAPPIAGMPDMAEMGGRGDRWQPLYQDWVEATQGRLKVRENPRFAN